ncbi:MAG: DUF4395 domain-containing protein [Propionibacteriaceae bacterium]|jgi:hypothetical protein|nr:DUF4395 domain-containing protein [Propionibacteriaceae bacterium]
MSISSACPIWGKTRDNNGVRFVAAESLLVAAGSVAVALLVGPRPAAVVTGLLAADFFLRAFGSPRHSPLAQLAGRITSALRLPRRLVDAAPKVFASRIGLAFTVAGTILLALGLTVPAIVVLGVLIVFAFLESVFAFCAGCWVYSLLPSRVAQALTRQFWADAPAVSPDASAVSPDASVADPDASQPQSSTAPSSGLAGVQEGAEEAADLGGFEEEAVVAVGGADQAGA